MTDSSFKLKTCRECGNAMYPPRERCPECLSDELDIKEVDSGAVILAATELHSSLEPYFQERLPYYMALVKLDAGPVAIASGCPGLTAGEIVKLEFRPHWTGNGIPQLSVSPADP